MRRMLSKDSFVDLAQQAAGAIRRMVSSTDSWNSRDVLSQTAQAVITACRGNNKIETATLEAWVDDLIRELEQQSAAAPSYGSGSPNSINGSNKKDATADAAEAVSTPSSSTVPSLPASPGKIGAWKPLSESSLLVNLDVARTLVFSMNAEAASTIYHAKEFVQALIRFYSSPSLTHKLRDGCAVVVVGICATQQELLRDCLRACGETLCETPADYIGNAIRILLAALLVEVLHQFHMGGYGGVKSEPDAHGIAYCKSLIDSTFHTACVLLQDATASPHTPASPRGDVEAGEAEKKPIAVAAVAAEEGMSSPTSTHTDPAVTAATAPVVAPPTTTVTTTATNTTTLTSPIQTNIDGAASPTNATAAATAAHANTNITVTTSVVFFAVATGVFRRSPTLKAYVLQTYGAEYTQLWAALASQLSHMQTTLQFPSSSRTAVAATLEPVEYWRSELLEGLVELCTEGCFTNQRAMAMSVFGGSGNSTGTAGVGVGAVVTSPARRVAATLASTAAGGTSAAAAAASQAGSGAGFCGIHHQYDSIPADWEAFLTSGAPAVWHLASVLYNCVITPDGADVVKAVLLQVNTKYASAETLYRGIICTLTLLCIANPRNAVILSEHQMLTTLIALVNCNQPSVFPSSEAVTLWSSGVASANTSGDDATLAGQLAATSAPRQVTLTLTPSNTLNVNTTQFTFCFLDTLTSTTFSKGSVEMLRKGIKDLYTVESSQTDVDVVENVLAGMCKSFIPQPMLYFPGDGYINWRLKQIFPRGSGYSFSAWIYPTCVWEGGSCLYSFSDQSDTRVSVWIVADGRLCSLAVRVNKAGGDPAELVLADGTFAASAWTHVVVNQGVALNVYINGRRLESVHDVPYPKEKHSLMFTMGGAAQLPGFYGYATGLNISSTLSEKDIARLYTAGPTLYEPSKDCASLLTPTHDEESNNDSLASSASPSVQHNELLAKRSSEFSWHHVEMFIPTNIEEQVVPHKISDWVLDVLHARNTATVQNPFAFMNVAKLCISLLSASMQLASNEELTSLVRKNYLDRLRAEVLEWDATFPEFAALLLQSMSTRGGGRALRPHACTQRIFDILLGCVMQTSARRKELLPSSPNMSNSTAGDDGVAGSPRTVAAAGGAPSSPLPPMPHQRSENMQDANATNIILRELSDCLLVKENLALFQEDPTRFQNILEMSLHVPRDCIKSVVILIEKLCRGETELRKVFLFLFTPSSTSPTADTAKVRVLRMLFDIAQEDVAMCEMIQECFKGRGFAFVLLLVNGEHHSSEAIRVLAIGLLSLLMPLKSCAKYFKKNDGFDILSMAITQPQSPIPLGIRTFDALIQVTFDEFRRHKEKKPEAADSIAVRLMAAAHLSHRGNKQRDAAAAASSTGGAEASAVRLSRRMCEYRGHTPTIAVNALGARRGYSFEHTHDYGKVNEDFGDLVVLHKGSRYHSLELPLALKTVLCALDLLIRTLVNRLPSGDRNGAAAATSALPTTTTTTSAAGAISSPISIGGTTGVGEYPSSPSHKRESGLTVGFSNVAAEDERVVLAVLNYLNKVIDYPKHALKLMDIQWLGGLWVATRVFFERPADVATGLSSSPVWMRGRSNPPSRTSSALLACATSEVTETAARRLHQDRGDFVNEVTLRTRTIIRKMVILDISTNERAQVRSIRDGDYPPRLVRIVLEEIARHFSVQKNAELNESAANIIRNLNSIFKDVQTALQPFPPSLGVAIVMAITNISVSSSMHVRRRMKNNSNLLTIRDNLAMYVLRESRRFLRLKRRALNQLIDINVNNAHSMTVLVAHLSNSIRDNNVNEVEVLVSLIQQLAGADSARLRELHSVLGEGSAVKELQELLSNSSGRPSLTSPLLPAAHTAQPTPSDCANSEVFTDVDSNAGGVVADRPCWNSNHVAGSNLLEDLDEVSPGAVTMQLLEWCRRHKRAWRAVQQSIHDVMTSLALDRKDDKKEERGSFLGGVTGGGAASVGGGSGNGNSDTSPRASAGGAAGVGFSERSKREFEHLRAEVEEELAKGTTTSAASTSAAAATTPRGSLRSGSVTH